MNQLLLTISRTGTPLDCNNGHLVIDSTPLQIHVPKVFPLTTKIIHMNHKQNQRTEFLFVTLTKISRDKAFKRLLKFEVRTQTN